MDEKKLLIADDSELNRAILVSVLEKNFDILEAADGKEAIATLAAHEGNIAALLLDVVMPEADGFEVLEEMNRRGWIDEIPTIMISVETGGSYIDRAFQLGAADYVSRPFVPNMIRRRVINAILLHTKTQKLTGLIADHFYRRERNTDILAAILGYAVEFRTGDELARYGGDEFLLLFHDMPRNALKKKLESIRAAVESLEFPEYPGLRITVSIGGAHAVGPLADTVQKADQALYHAKAAKNRTVLYKEDLQ